MVFRRRARDTWQEVMVVRCCMERRMPVVVHGESSMMVACQRGVPSCKMTRVIIASPASVANSDVMVVAACVG